MNRSLLSFVLAVAWLGGCQDARRGKRHDASAPASAAWVNLEAGAFVMGSPFNEGCRGDDETPEASAIEHGLVVAAYETTQRDFAKRMAFDPSFNAGCSRCPVDSVTYGEAARYCSLLSEEEGLDACYRCTDEDEGWHCEKRDDGPCTGYRLPTEAEWEYFTRAGTLTATFAGPVTSCMSRDEVVDQIGWYKANSDGYTHPVGSLRANPWGLYDLAGNVYEWTENVVDSEADLSADDIDAEGFRILRGGSWFHNAHHTRSASRLRAPSDRRFSYAGFRCVRTLHAG